MAALLEAETATLRNCVLLVDDDAVIRMVVSESMRDAGLSVIEARCGSDAIIHLRAGIRVDLIMSDIRYAGSADGLALARHVRAEYPAIPVIMTSGGAKPAELDDAEIFIPKPYVIADVTAVIKKILSSSDNNPK